jgi:hypothetical protein
MKILCLFLYQLDLEAWAIFLPEICLIFQLYRELMLNYKQGKLHGSQPVIVASGLPPRRKCNHSILKFQLLFTSIML